MVFFITLFMLFTYAGNSIAMASNKVVIQKVRAESWGIPIKVVLYKHAGYYPTDAIIDIVPISEGSRATLNLLNPQKSYTCTLNQATYIEYFKAGSTIHEKSDRAGQYFVNDMKCE